MKYFAVPQSIAQKLSLTDIRTSNGSLYLLSGQDLCCYGEERAVSEGAKEVTREQAKKMFNL
jgi:hypothetical protein